MNVSGLITLTTSKSVDACVERILRLLEEKQVKLFAVIDHSGEARAAGLSMPDTKVVIFGNPKAGTPLMLAAPSIAIDLPLKILVAADPIGQTQITYTAPEFLGERHGLPGDLVKNLQAVATIAQVAAGD